MNFVERFLKSSKNRLRGLSLDVMLKIMWKNYAKSTFATSKPRKYLVSEVLLLLALAALMDFFVLLSVVDLYPRVSLPDIEFRHTIPPHLRPMISPALLSKDSAYPGDAVPDR